MLAMPLHCACIYPWLMRVFMSIQVLSKICHPFIVAFHGAMQDPDNIYYLLEFCRGGDLGSLLCKYGSLNWATSQFFLTEILLAVHFLHLKQVDASLGRIGCDVCTTLESSPRKK